MNNPLREDREDWVIILEYMYENKVSFDTSDMGGIETLRKHIVEHIELKEEIGIEEDELSDTKDFLENSGLIEDSVDGFGLTQQGLQLAHQIKTERQRRYTNILLVALTFILTVLTIGLFVAEILSLL